MAWGCLALLVLLGGSSWLVYDQAVALALPWPWVIAGSVGLTATLALGSLQGLAMAWRQARRGYRATALKNGAKVRLSGTLRPIAASGTAPISGRAAVYCTYSGRAPHQEALPLKPVDPHWRGMIAVPCVLSSGGRELRLLGMPSLRGYPQQSYFGPKYHATVARHQASTHWERSGSSAMFDLGSAADDFAGIALQGDGDARHLINDPALKQLALTVGETTAEALLPRLSERNWTFYERVVAPGTKVTLTGIYRDHPPALDVSFSLRNPDHILRLGSASTLAAREVFTALTFTVVFGALALWGLSDLYRHDGASFRAVLERFHRSD